MLPEGLDLVPLLEVAGGATFTLAGYAAYRLSRQAFRDAVTVYKRAASDADARLSAERKLWTVERAAWAVERADLLDHIERAHLHENRGAEMETDE